MEVFSRLREIVAQLRSQCPWDRSQTFESLAPLTWEEVAELLEAVEQRNPDAITEELGDVLLHVFFYAQIAQEQGLSDIEKVAERLVHKLIARHPHVYGEQRAMDARAVIAQWEALKRQEKSSSALAGVPERLSPFIQAYRLQEKAAAWGFDWASPQSMMPKLYEELEEMQRALEQGDFAQAAQEIGDVLFVLVNLARHLGIHPERAIQATNRKFRQRFTWMEAELAKQQKDPHSCSAEELELYWQASKAYFP